MSFPEARRARLGTITVPGGARKLVHNLGGFGGLTVALALVAAAWTYFAYRTSPLVALAAPLAVVVVALIGWRPMSGIYLSLLAIPLEPFDFHVGGAADITPAKGLLFLTGVLAAARLLGGRPARLNRFHPAHVAFLALVAIAALGLTVAVHPYVTAKILAQWSAYLSVSVVAATADERQLRRILGCLALSGAIVGAISVLTLKSQQLVAGGQAATNRAQAGFTHPAILAFFLELALPPALALAFRWRASLRGPALAAAGLCLAGVTVSLTRGAILGVGVSLLVMLWWAPFRRLAGALIAVLLVFLAVNHGAIERSHEVMVVGQRLQTITDTQVSQSNERLLIWSKTPAIIADHPFLGIGEGNYEDIAPQYGVVSSTGSVFIHAHNVFLTIGAELGLLGLAVFVYFLLTVAAPAARMLRRHREDPVFPFGVALTAALAGLLFTSLTDYPPANEVIMAVIMIQVGAFVAVQRMIAARTSHEPPRVDPHADLAAAAVA